MNPANFKPAFTKGNRVIIPSGKIYIVSRDSFMAISGEGGSRYVDWLEGKEIVYAQPINEKTGNAWQRSHTFTAAELKLEGAQ